MRHDLSKLNRFQLYIFIAFVYALKLKCYIKKLAYRVQDDAQLKHY